MSKKSRKINTELMKTLLAPDIEITFSNLSEYATKPSVSYFVFQGIDCKFEMNIEPKRFGIANYTIIRDNGDKFSCRARANAVFLRRPVADDILEIYRTIKLRHLIQQFKTKRK